MGKWYMLELERSAGQVGHDPAVMPGPAQGTTDSTGIIIYIHPNLAHFRVLVAAARERLAEIEAAYTFDKSKVSVLQARLFKKLRPFYEKRDRVRLVVSYRQIFLEKMLREGEEAAAEVEETFRHAADRMRQEYAETEAVMESKKQLSESDEGEIKRLWKKLVTLFHPDRYEGEPDKVKTYEKLTAAINAAKDTGSLETLRKIADDPVGFVLRQGWTAIDFGDTDELNKLRRLWESLEAEILTVLEASIELKESPDWELHQLVELEPDVLEQVAERQIEGINAELAELEAQAEKLKSEIKELSGGDGTSIV